MFFIFFNGGQINFQNYSIGVIIDSFFKQLLICEIILFQIQFYNYFDHT